MSALSGLAASKEGEWRCDTCMVMNKNDASKCVCCEALRPTSSAAAAIASSPPASASAATGGAADWRCGTCMVMNKAEASKCVCCEATRPTNTAASTGSLAAAPSSPAPAAGGFQSPAPQLSEQPLVKSARPGEGRRLSPIPEDEQGQSRPDSKRRGVDLIATGAASDASRSDDKGRGTAGAPVAPRVLGSPRLLSYSCLVTDLEAATCFLREVAGMEVCRHEDYHQTFDGGLGFNGRNGIKLCWTRRRASSETLGPTPKPRQSQ